VQKNNFVNTITTTRPYRLYIYIRDESGVFHNIHIQICIYYTTVDGKEEWKGYTSPPCRFVVRHTPSTSYTQCHD